jgi:hypothetical protein
MDSYSGTGYDKGIDVDTDVDMDNLYGHKKNNTKSFESDSDYKSK